MMVVDTSAIIAILTSESDGDAFLEAIREADQPVMSAVSYQEAGFVLFGRLGSAGLEELGVLLSEMSIEIIPHDERLARLAIEAFQRFGKGIHARARLNFGDCATYALAASLNAPLLFKGGDFAATDLTSAL
jgi:ribonuclease VapC